MKRFFPLLLVAFSTVLLGSCSGKSQLAADVAGSWGSSPELLTNEPASQSTIIETISFERNSSSTGGTILISSMISITGTLNESSAIVQPLNITAAAKAFISGDWQAIDDDEIHLRLQPTTLVVDVDPSAVSTSVDVLTGTDSAAIDSLRPQLAGSIRAHLTRQLQARYMDYGHLDDVKVKDSGTILKFEIKDKDVVMHRL